MEILELDLSSYNETLTKVRNNNSINVRRYKPQIPNAFRPFPRSTSNHKLNTDSPDIKTSFSLEKIISVYQSNQKAQIQHFTIELCSAAANHKSLVKSIVENPELVELIVNQACCMSTSASLSSYSSLISLIIEKDDAAVIDNGILFMYIDLISEFPIEVLRFFFTLPTLSIYARDALVCMGVIDNIIDLCSETSDENVHIAAAQVLNAIFGCQEPVNNDDIRVNISKIITLLNLPEVDAVKSIILTLVEIIGRNCSNCFVSNLFQEGVHIFIARSIQIPELTAPCICLAGNMAACESIDFQKLLDAGVVQALMSLLQSDFAGDSFWALSNCVESSPDMMIEFFTESYFGEISMALDNCPYQIFRDAAYFIATMLLFSPVDKVNRILSYNGLLLCVIQMLDCGISNIVIRCMDSLARILFLGYTRLEMEYVINIVTDTDDVYEHLTNLLDCDDPTVVKKAKCLMNEIDTHRTTEQD